MSRKIYLFLLSAAACLVLLLLHKPVGKSKDPNDKVSITTREIMNISYRIEPDCGPGLLLWLIHSSPGNSGNREAIREAYPSEELEKFGVRRIFLLGEPKNPGEQILEESRTFQDLLQGDFLDSYGNLTRKHLMGLSWASEQCKKSLLVAKMDDDIVLDLFRLLRLVRNGTIDEDKISGFLMHRQKPERDRENKWFVSKDEYMEDTYPDFVSGWFYLTSMNVVNKLVSEAANTNDYLWIDDVFVTGVLRDRLGVQIKDLSDYFATDYRFLECCVRGKKEKLRCDFLVGPDGGKKQLQVKFKTFAKFCDSNCVDRDEKRSVKKSCVSSMEESWRPIKGSARIDPVAV